ncbi:MAG: hypothetical protein CM15mV66_470 [uncultured marine virus]|jgi:hypothetical protein|nr:MAG: hypothetical protein CM15mV66_470 [uncultured marine virus]
MAYATSNPIKKISQMGDTNSLWYYSDGDAIGTIDDADYFLSATGDLNAGDVIIVNSGGSNGVVDILIVSAATSSTVTTVILA